MAGNLNNDINNRLTPSVPLELTFQSLPAATGRKITTIFGHMTSGGGTGTPYGAYLVQNTGDKDAAKAEVDGLAGAGSQIGKMAYAFVSSVQDGGISGQKNFTQFRVVLIPNSISTFGPANEAITAVKNVRSDMFVSCYDATDSANKATLLSLVQLVSGIDRDLQGQFGSFMTLGTLADRTTARALAYNSPYILIAHLPDSNTAAIAGVTGSTTLGSPAVASVAQAPFTPTGDTDGVTNVLTSVSDTSGILPGASITGTGIPASTIVISKTSSTLTISQNTTSANVGETLTVTNQPTAGINVGAQIAGAGIPLNTTILSVSSSGFVMSANATATASGVSITVQNVVSQAFENVASAHAGALMASGFPYYPVTGITVGGLVPPRIQSDWIQIDPNGDSEAELVSGLSPLYIQPGNTVGFIRSRTTWTLLANNVTPVTNYFDWQQLVVLNDFKEIVFSVSQNPPFNGNPGGTKNSAQIQKQFKDEVLRNAVGFEQQSAFQNVKQLAPYFIVQASTSDPSRMDFKIPVQAVPGLEVIAGNIQAVSDLASFLQFQL